MSDSNPLNPEAPAQEATHAVEPLRFHADDAPPALGPDYVVVEDVLVINIEDVGSYTLMCTPHDTRALAVGFAFSEGIISGVDDIKMLYHCEDAPGVICIELADSTRVYSRERTLILTTSCGMCGSREAAERILSGASTVGQSLNVTTSLLLSIMADMQARQGLFAQTGGTHAAAIFSGAGEIVAFSEDIGRHNALDKAIGKCLLAGVAPAGCAVALSGRVSFELVAKSARAGLELIAAVSAASSLAIEAAERCNITLCGFVRDDRLTVYTRPQRIPELHE